LRTFPEQPIVGVGAVVFSGERVLLVKRGHAPLQGEWSLPGGAVELGEALETAVAREVKEEAGLVVDVGPVVEVVDRVHRDADGRVEYHYVVVDYLCQLTGPTAGSATAGSDADEIMWAPLEDLVALNVTAGAVAVIRKASAMTAGVANRPS
jgi:ADP-ribose pyrophosphatase YjhB (NUDIX family)